MVGGALRMASMDDLDLRMLVGVAEQVAHVEVVEIDAGVGLGFRMTPSRLMVPGRVDEEAKMQDPGARFGHKNSVLGCQATVSLLH